MFPLDEYDEGTSDGGNGNGGNGAGGSADAGGGSEPIGGSGGGGSSCTPGTNPPVSGIVSDFDTAIGADLGLLNCAQVVDGQLHTSPAFESEYCWLYTNGARSLACDAVTVRLIAYGTQDLGIHRFMYIRENVGDGALNVLQEVEGFSGDLTYSDSSFDESQDAWWRLSADETTVTFETSPDGVTWTFKGSGVPGFPLDDVSIAVGSGMWQTVAAPGVDRFDCFNVAPPCGD